MATISTDQFYPAVGVSADGPLFGVPVFKSSDETVLALVVSADGMTVDIMPVAPGGPARVSATAEADPTPGVNTLVGVTEDVTVTLGRSSEAKVLTLTLSAPVDKVVPPPAPTP